MRTSISKLSFLTLPVFALTACQDYEPFDEATVVASLKSREYTNNFISHYGDVDPNHTWGFEKMIATNSIETRALAAIDNGEQGNQNVNTERNNWVSWGMQVPGWPNFDGKYYDSSNQTEYIKYDTDPGLNNIHPCGDVTDFEVDYVSRWFRTHPKGDRELEKRKVQLHLSDFYIQNVSSDNDRKNYPDGELITTTLGQNNTDFGMDHLLFKSAQETTIGKLWTHANDFNSGNSNHNPEHYVNDGTITPKPDNANTNRVIKYIKSAGTEDFAYHSSFSTDQNAYFNEWVLIKLEWEEEGIMREGYYLAFDYEATKSSTEVEYGPDGYYSNWIIKISPANYTPSEDKSKECRVMCEDLGNTFDFDFNDVVFDVRFERTTGTWDGDPAATFDAIVTLRAAGGTLPIFVGKQPTELDGFFEAHKMLGYNSSTPVNVGGSKSNTVANYRITGLPSPDAELIDIYVVNNGATISLTSTLGHNLGDNYGAETNNSHTAPKPGIGSNKVPQRFCVPTTVQWMKECQFIEQGYPSFKDWAGNDNGNADWYKTFGDTSKIYQ